MHISVFSVLDLELLRVNEFCGHKVFCLGGKNFKFTFQSLLEIGSWVATKFLVGSIFFQFLFQNKIMVFLRLSCAWRAMEGCGNGLSFPAG